MAMTTPEQTAAIHAANKKDTALLNQYANLDVDGRFGDHWWFSSPRYTYSRTQAMTIIRFSLELGTEPTDTLTSELFGKLVQRVVNLEDRLAALERPRED
jgi:hypothetical protein